MKNKDQVFLLLGGNIGNVEETFRKARNEINVFARIVKESSIYKTEAWGMSDAPDFLNQALLVTTDLVPNVLLQRLEELEKELGRSDESKAGKSYSSRVLDIDILLWGNKEIDSEGLTIPHPRFHLRNFSLVPLQEIAPEFEHPLKLLSISELKEQSPDSLKVEKI